MKRRPLDIENNRDWAGVGLAGVLVSLFLSLFLAMTVINDVPTAALIGTLLGAAGPLGAWGLFMLADARKEHHDDRDA